ncbi:MAG: response regulator transcription factor [Cytophagales bacterium]|nr:response regulator transcription factor [Cytophagales bacterium]
METTPIRILLVDDHVLFTQGLASALGLDESFEVVNTFSDARSALGFISQNPPELIVTDISMPDMNGLLFIDKVHASYPEIKILIISMFEPFDIMKKAHGYLNKDATVQEVSHVIKEIVLHQKKCFPPKSNELKTSELAAHGLTKREQQVVTLIAGEYTVDQIAEKLFISRTTVESHKKNIFLKLKVTTNAGLVRKSIQLGYL